MKGRVFRLTVLVKEESSMMGNLAARSRHGVRNLKLRAHILNYKQETEQTGHTFTEPVLRDMLSPAKVTSKLS